MSDIEAVNQASARTPSVRSDDETRHLIADAAQREFLAHGYVGACVDDIAKSAGVSKKTLYRLDTHQGRPLQGLRHRSHRAVHAGDRRQTRWVRTMSPSRWSGC